MGYGGNLIWTAVIKTLHEQGGPRLAVVNRPCLSDLISGRLYDGGTSLANDDIFRNNPRVVFPAKKEKPALVRFLDRVFVRALGLFNVLNLYERIIFSRSEKAMACNGLRLLHVDMRIHSYAERQTAKRMIWKPQSRVADAVLANFGSGPASENCEIYLTNEEYSAVDALIKHHGLSDGFVVIEPATNRDYFGDLRAWPPERWPDLIARLRAAHPKLPIAQVGISGRAALPDVVDLRGKTDFRGACALLSRCSLFIGTEGGLMHAANAVGANALILWGGVTLPEFAGYPARQRTICKRVACAPCGQLGWCDNGHICMTEISVGEVAVAALECLPPIPSPAKGLI